MEECQVVYTSKLQQTLDINVDLVDRDTEDNVRCDSYTKI